MSDRCYVTVACSHPKQRKDTAGRYLCPRYCGTGRHVLRRVPALYPDRTARAVEREPARARPAPEVAMREAREGEISSGALRLAKAMRAKGMSLRMTYARGTTPDREYLTGRVDLGAVVDSVCVRGERLRAVWESGRIVGAWRREPGEDWRAVGLAALLGWVDAQ